MIMIFSWNMKIEKKKKKIACPESCDDNKKRLIGCLLLKGCIFLLDVFQITAIALVSEINQNYINELHLFWDILYILISQNKL